MQRNARFNVTLLLEDMDERGWQPVDLAIHASVARSTVSRFLSGEHQTAHTAKKIAEALGRSLRRYVIRTTGSGARS